MNIKILLLIFFSCYIIPVLANDELEQKNFPYNTVINSCNAENDSTYYIDGISYIETDTHTQQELYDYESSFFDYCISPEQELVYVGRDEDYHENEARYYTVLKDVDLTTFRHFTSNFNRDKNRAYINGHALNNVDFSSFKEITSGGMLLYRGMATDKNYFYYKGESPVKIDSDTFTIIDYGGGYFKQQNGAYRYEYKEFYFRDKNYVYYFRDMDGFSQLSIITSADSKHFQYLDTINELQLFADQNNLYYGGKRLHSIDRGSWQRVGNNYVKDNNHVYYITNDPNNFLKQVTGVDAKTFSYDLLYKDKNAIFIDGAIVPFSDSNALIKINNTLFYDKNHIYVIHAPERRTTLVTASEINSLQYLADVYFKDKKRIYYKENQIIDADANSFKVLVGGHYAKDKYAVYYDGKKIDNTDPNTFNVFSKNIYYAKDKNHIYYEGKKQLDIDTNSFQIFEKGMYSKDKNNVYYLMQKLIDANSLHFQTIKPHAIYGKDKTHVYYEGKLIAESDPTSFKHLSGAYSKDAKNVYFRGEKIDAATSKSFIVSRYNMSYAKDNQYFYSDGNIITPTNDIPF